MTMKDEASDEKIRFTPDILHANERDELIDFSQEQFDMLFDVVRLAQASNALGAKVTTIGKTTRATVFSTTRIRAKLAEVKDIFFSEHTHFATGFTQSQQIYTLLTPSNNHPMRSAAVRWSLVSAPSKMVRKRDVVYVEYMDEFEDDNGRRGWARCTHSIEHRSCPPLVNSHNIVRAHMYCSGSIYTETDEPGVLEVITLFDVDTRGIPAWMSKLTALRKAQSATNVEHLIKLSRVMSDEEDPEVKLIEFQVKGKVCRGCGDKISKWSTPRKCRECKEPLCKSCSDVVYYKSEERKKIKNICVYCVDEELSDGDMRGDYCGGLDAINENFVHAPRRSNHMSFRSLRLARETNVSISPVYASSRRSSLSYSRSASVASLTTQPPHMNPSMQRRQSDPGMTGSRQSLSRHHTSPTLRSSRSIAV